MRPVLASLALTLLAYAGCTSIPASPVPTAPATPTVQSSGRFFQKHGRTYYQNDVFCRELYAESGSDAAFMRQIRSNSQKIIDGTGVLFLASNNRENVRYTLALPPLPASSLTQLDDAFEAVETLDVRLQEALCSTAVVYPFA